jgi:aarF domain-containing kinase
MKGELADECNYTREASFLTQFGSSAFLGNDPRFKVPWVWDGSTSTVLVMEYVDGASVGEAIVGGLSQADRDDVSCSLLTFAYRWLCIICVDCCENNRTLLEGAV